MLDVLRDLAPLKGQCRGDNSKGVSEEQEPNDCSTSRMGRGFFAVMNHYRYQNRRGAEQPDNPRNCGAVESDDRSDVVEHQAKDAEKN